MFALLGASRGLNSGAAVAQGGRDAPNLPRGYMAQQLAAKQQAHLPHGGKPNEQARIARPPASSAGRLCLHGRL